MKYFRLFDIKFIVFTLALFAAASDVYADALYFSVDEIAQWQQKSFEGNTAYEVVEADGQHVLQAQSQASASSLIYQGAINLSETPYINWSWKVDRLPRGSAAETTLEGDDFAARIYFLFSTGFGFWNVGLLNYVWSNQIAEGEHWLNPNSNRVTMLAIESGDKKLGRWQHYKRNITADIKRYTGKNIRKLKAVAIMTDSDNTRDSLKTYYGDIWFSAD